MKAKLLLIALLSTCFILHSQTTSVPDDNFENYLETHDANGNIVSVGDPMSMGDGTANNDLVLTSRINTVTDLDMFNIGINDLTGIEDFAALERLEVWFSNLTTVDISANTTLTYLDIRGNSLNSLDVSANTALEYLNCQDNNLNSLSVGVNTALTTLTFSGNNVNTIDVSANTLLEVLGCASNSMNTLDVSMNTALTRLICNNNNLTTLNLANNTNLDTLFCYGNGMTTLTLPNTNTLTRLDCYNNSLSGMLDVSNFTNLSILWCYNNNLSGTLDLTNNTLLTNVDIGDNNFSAVNMPNDADTLTRLFADNLNITSLDVSNNNVLERLFIPNNTLLTSVTLPNSNATLWRIDAYSSGLTSLDASGLSVLEYIDVYFCNSLASMTLPPTTTLTSLWAYTTSLSSLDFTNNTGLINMDIANGNFTEIDISMLPNLFQFYCNESDLLTSLNVANGNNMNMEWMWAQDNPMLSCIQVDDAAQAGGMANWQKDAGASYDEDCSLSLNDELLLDVMVYPNPFVNEIMLKTNLNGTYELFDLSGKLVITGNLEIGEKTIHVADLTSSMYFLRVSTFDGKRITKKVIRK